MKPLDQMKIAIVHEWLTAVAGSEKVLQQLLVLFPNADLFVLVDHLPASQRGFLKGRKVRTTFLQNLPWSAKLFRKLLWLQPSAVETFDVSAYDHGGFPAPMPVAKGVLTGPDQLHICYCHSPIRYAWDLQHQYLRGAGMERGFKSLCARATLHYLRIWDVRTANGVGSFCRELPVIANPDRKAYRRGVDRDPSAGRGGLCSPFEADKEDYYITASRIGAL